MKKLLVVAAAALLAFSACKGKNDVIAKVGSEKITQETLNEKLASFPPDYQNYVQATESGKKQFISGVVREKVLIEAAKRAGVDKSKDYKSALESYKQDQKRQLEEFKNTFLLQTFVAQLQSKMVVTDEQIQAYYKANQAEFDKPVAYTVKHILVPSKALAEAALQRLKAGESFDKVAKEVSQDASSAKKGGLIGPFKKGDLVKEFEEVAMSLKVGEMSGIVETSYGYHIILKVSQTPLPKMTFDQAKSIIKAILEKQQVEDWFAAEYKKLGVEINYDAALQAQNQK